MPISDTRMPRDKGNEPVPVLAFGTNYILTSVTASTPAASAFPVGVLILRLVSTNNCFVTFAASPTAAADTTSTFIPALTEVFIKLDNKGTAKKIAVIKASGQDDGTLYVTEMV